MSFSSPAACSPVLRCPFPPVSLASPIHTRGERRNSITPSVVFFILPFPPSFLAAPKQRQELPSSHSAFSKKVFFFRACAKLPIFCPLIVQSFPKRCILFHGTKNSNSFLAANFRTFESLVPSFECLAARYLHRSTLREEEDAKGEREIARSTLRPLHIRICLGAQFEKQAENLWRGKRESVAFFSRISQN